MFRVGIDGRELQQGVYTGIARYVVQVVKAAAEAGLECIVYRSATCDVPSFGENVRSRIVPQGRALWQDQWELPVLMKQDRLSLFLSPYYKAPLLAPCPVILTIHDLMFIGYPGRSRPLSDYAMTKVSQLYAMRASAIITDSEFSKRVIVKKLGVPPEKIIAIPLALPRGFGPKPIQDIQADLEWAAEPYILSVGNFKPHKNLLRLIDAYSQLPGSLRRDVRLVLVGRKDSYRPFLEGYVKRLGLESRVLFPGAIEDKDLPALYTHAQMLVLPSLIEGFGLTALEAMACECPVAASNRASIPEVVGDAALMFDPENVSSISQAMSRLLTDVDTRVRCRTSGLARTKQFTAEHTTGRIIKLILYLAAGRTHTKAGPSTFESEEEVHPVHKKPMVSR